MSVMNFFYEFINSKFPSTFKGGKTAEGFIFGVVTADPSASDGYMPGAFVFRTDTKILLYNTGTKASPTWTKHVSDLDFDANTILAANADNTPLALTVAASRILGRKSSGNIGALTSAEIRAILQTPESILIGIGDEATDLTTGTAKYQFIMPYAFTLTEVRCSVANAPTDATLIVDINDGGSTIMTTDKLDILTTATIDDGTAALTDLALADKAVITVDIDQIGSTQAGKGLKVYLIGYQA